MPREKPDRRDPRVNALHGRRPLAKEPLTEDDWREVYHFMRYVYQPFMEGIVYRARLRASTPEPQPGAQPTDR